MHKSTVDSIKHSDKPEIKNNKEEIKKILNDKINKKDEATTLKKKKN